MRLIAPKAISEFTPEEFHRYVSEMYQLPRGKCAAGAPQVSRVPGLSITRSKTGRLVVRRNPKVRAFDYVTRSEIAALAKGKECNQADLWNAFKARKFIISGDRMEAEQIYAHLRGAL